MAVYLITGGAGFIGSHLAEALVKTRAGRGGAGQFGHRQAGEPHPRSKRTGKAHLYSRRHTGHRRPASGPWPEVDYVLHLAARPSVKRSIDDPLLSHEVNVTGGLNVLSAAKEAGVKRLVNVSSSSVYGDRKPLDTPKEESMPPLPVSPYAVNKLAMENYCSVFYKDIRP